MLSTLLACSTCLKTSHSNKPMNPAAWLLCTALAVTLPAQADTLTGRVVAIADGDTLTVLDAQHTQHRIRLAGIDAPEQRQPWGEQSKANLARMAFDQVVTVEWEKRDRYQRIVGKVLALGAFDTGLAQIDAGLAWHYKKYQGEQSPADREAYAAAEDQARASRRGLWQDSGAMPPWAWRKLPH